MGRSSLQAQDPKLASEGQKLGCILYEVESGRRAWPYHYHGANKEAIYWLEGSGTLRVNGEEVVDLRGQLRGLPVERGRSAQFVTTSHKTLMYLCFSTMTQPDTIV